MDLYCTYCSADKNHSDNPIPAVELYKSERIKGVYQMAENAGVAFAILSGKHGLVAPQERIDYYDHLLLPSEVEAHSELVATQLNGMQVSKVVFHTVSLNQDPNLKTYIDCMGIACAKSEVTLEVIELD